MKDIKGYPGYKINENGIIINKKGHVMSTAISNSGYLRTSLEIYDEDGKLLQRDNKSIHRLVAENFIPNPDNLEIVMHKDNDKLHNNVSNLKWGTQSENFQQAISDGLIKNFGKYYYGKYIYTVSSPDESEIIRCKGTKGVADLIGFSSANSIRPGTILSGEYKGYIIKNTKIKTTCPIFFNM